MSSEAQISLRRSRYSSPHLAPRTASCQQLLTPAVSSLSFSPKTLSLFADVCRGIGSCVSSLHLQFSLDRSWDVWSPSLCGGRCAWLGLFRDRDRSSKKLLAKFPREGLSRAFWSWPGSEPEFRLLPFSLEQICWRSHAVCDAIEA